ncbi:MAG: hypothetical protein IKP61_06100 [Spirochaetales bacterium]|nr:hypothetical protein [Spirochaetales bacterium]
MKKTFSVVITLALLVALVSCASSSGTAAAETEAQVINVSSIEELAKAAKTKGATVVLTGDISWNPDFTGDSPLEINVGKKTVIDLNGHTISNVKSCAFRLFGDFTIQNGTIISEGDSYALLINSNNTTSGVDYKPDTRENHKVTVDGLTIIEGGIRAELSTINVSNCDVQNSGESGQSNCLYFVGVVAKVTDCKLNQTANAIETISRTNCVYCSGNSTIRLTNLTLEGTKRLNAYQNTISYRVENCPGWVTTTPAVVR